MRAYSVIPGSTLEMFAEKSAAFIEQIRGIDGVAAVPLSQETVLSPENILTGNSTKPWFGALSATLLASADQQGTSLT